ncbi:MAG: hypothetical protein KGI51_02030 [Rhodospirillales bacterium]|nr:hypothetical protein [Rhodospirillales bacterium]
MEYVCDAPGDTTWFRLVTEGEAAAESLDMRHAVEKYFRREWARAEAEYRPLTSVFIEQDIGRADHARRTMPLFLTLRDMDGVGHATAMLPPGGKADRSFSPIIVGPANSDPYATHEEAILALARHFGLALERARCYPYRR